MSAAMSICNLSWDMCHWLGRQSSIWNPGCFRFDVNKVQEVNKNAVIYPWTDMDQKDNVINVYQVLPHTFYLFWRNMFITSKSIWLAPTHPSDWSHLVTCQIYLGLMVTISDPMEIISWWLTTTNQGMWQLKNIQAAENTYYLGWLLFWHMSMIKVHWQGIYQFMRSEMVVYICDIDLTNPKKSGNQMSWWMEWRKEWEGASLILIHWLGCDRFGTASVSLAIYPLAWLAKDRLCLSFPNLWNGGTIAKVVLHRHLLIDASNQRVILDLHKWCIAFYSASFN